MANAWRIRHEDEKVMTDAEHTIARDAVYRLGHLPHLSKDDLR
jgi:hypothetical protein